MSLKVGDVVILKVRNPVWPRRSAYASYVHIPEFYEYTGQLLKPEKRDVEQVRITGDAKYPVRLIDIDRIEDVILG